MQKWWRKSIYPSPHSGKIDSSISACPSNRVFFNLYFSYLLAIHCLLSSVSTLITFVSKKESKSCKTNILFGSIFTFPQIPLAIREQYAPISTIGAFFFFSFIPILRKLLAFLCNVFFMNIQAPFLALPVDLNNIS